MNEVFCFTKFQGHKAALDYQRLLGSPGVSEDASCSTTANPPPASTGTQVQITTAFQKQAKEGYRKLFTTAYHLAVDGLPLSSFKTFVKVQKSNGLKLIEGTDSSDRAREFVHEIADTIRRKLTSMISSCSAFSVLSDGSQARKTGNEKELVMVRVVRSGRAMYFVVALEDIDSYGDATAENLLKSIDNAFQCKLNIPLAKYTASLVSATADGASVNTGQ